MINQKKSRKKTVLIITSHYPPNIGGVESHLQALVNALLKRNWQVIISTYQPLASKKHAKIIDRQGDLIIYRAPWLGFNIVHKLTPYPPLEFLYLFPLLCITSLFICYRHFKDIKVIHSQGLVPATIGLLLKNLFNKRLISSIHNLYFYPKTGLYRTAARIIFSGSDLVLAPTSLAQDELRSIGIPKEKVSGFRYWLDLDKFKPTKKTLAKNKLKWRVFTAFFVGRLIKTKGVLEILKSLKKLDKHIKVVIAGDGPLRLMVEQAAKEYPNLDFLGRVENYDLPEYYSAADLLLVPSLVDEGWGFVAMESISCGTPVISARKGGLSDVVNKDVGILIEPNAKELKEAMESFYKNRSSLQKLAKNTRKYAKKNFGEDSVKLIITAYK